MNKVSISTIQYISKELFVLTEGTKLSFQETFFSKIILVTLYMLMVMKPYTLFTPERKTGWFVENVILATAL